MPSSIPTDDPKRSLTVAGLEHAEGRYVSLAGDTYTVLVTGNDTAGKYCLIDMHVPDGGGPPPHRHDFEEMFTVLEGSVEFTFRGEKTTVSQGATVNIPANAPHSFKNISGSPARLLCMCTPAGQDEFFMQVGDVVDGPHSPPPMLSGEELQKRKARAMELAPRYRTEMLGP